ncbi:MAG: glycosyltransferase family 2 protein [Pseudorhodobacter sp.]|nr:glycosyltransferase family 2 protein [Rhizobacter sp.]
MQNPHSLTVVIVAKNEETNIAECVASAAFADAVLVLDSGSTDATASRAAAAGARVVQTDWPGYGSQVARGFGMTDTAWVMSLDADERITPRLRDEILASTRAAQFDGFRIPRISEFCGKVIHHSGWKPDHTLRLGRRDKSGFTDHFLHAHMTLNGVVGDLKSSLIHYSYPNVANVLEKLDRYSTGAARDMQTRGKQDGVGRVVVHGVFAFLRSYVLRRGFLDGSHGLMLAIYNAEYAYYKYIKLMFLAHPPKRPVFPDEGGQ